MKKTPINKLKKGDVIREEETPDGLLFGKITSIQNRGGGWAYNETSTNIYFRPLPGDADYGEKRKKQPVVDLSEYLDMYGFKKITVLTEDEMALYLLKE